MNNLRKKSAEGSLGHQLALASYHYFITKNTQRSYERARQWMRDHPQAFFNPNAN